MLMKAPRRGEIAQGVLLRTYGVVFLVDNNSGLLTAISYDSPTNTVTWLRSPIDIGRLANAAGGNRR